jgi:phosphoserine phosphatase RsbU/P
MEFSRSSLTGGTREEIVELPSWATPWWIYTPVASEQAREAIRHAAAGEFVRQDATLLNSTGQVTVFDFSLYPIRDGQGKVVLLVP